MAKALNELVFVLFATFLGLTSARIIPRHQQVPLFNSSDILLPSDKPSGADVFQAPETSDDGGTVLCKQTTDSTGFPITCCFVEAILELDACLWDAYGMDAWLSSYAQNPPPNGNWVEALYASYTDSSQYCTIEDCDLDIPMPSSDVTDSEMQQFLALVAARNYMMYQGASWQVMTQAYEQFLGDQVTTLIEDFGQSKQVTSQYDNVATGLEITGAALSIIAAPLSGGASAAVGILAGSFGVAGGVASLAGSLPKQPPSVSFRDIGGHLNDSFTIWAEALIDTTNNYMSDANQALNLMTVPTPWNYVFLQDVPIWTNPLSYIQAAEDIWTYWTMSKIFQGLGLTIHMDPYQGPSCLHSSTVQDYPQQGCDVFQDFSTGVNFSTYYFPMLYFYDGSNEQSPNDIRNYGSANNMNNYNMNFYTVTGGSANCQYYYSPLTSWDSSQMYPEITDWDSIWNTIAANGQVSTLDYCFWNLPIVKGDDPMLLGPCVNDQGCCTGNGADDAEPGNYVYWADNLGLDDWASGGAGNDNTLGEGNWSDQC